MMKNAKHIYTVTWIVDTKDVKIHQTTKLYLNRRLENHTIEQIIALIFYILFTMGRDRNKVEKEKQFEQ